MKNTTIIETVIVLYVILFLNTGISKLIDYSVFKEQLAASPVLSPLAKPIALFLPCVEYLVVLLLLIPRWRLKGLYISLALMTLITGYIVAILRFSDQLPCSCGGIIELLSRKQHILFNTVFISMAIYAILLQSRLKRDQLRQWDLIINTSFSITPERILKNNIYG